MKARIFLCFFLLLSACSSTLQLIQGGKGDFDFHQPFISVPFEEIRGMIFVRVFLNQSLKERVFLVDTAASVSVLSQEVFEELSLKPLKKVPVMGVQKKGELTLTQLSSLQLGGVVFKNLGFLVYPDLKKVSDLSEVPIHGILGHNALRFFRVQFNFEAKTLTFYQTPLKNPQITGIPMGLRWDLGPFIDAYMFGKKVGAIIDTGSVRVVFPKKWALNFSAPLWAIKGSLSYGFLGFVEEEYFTPIRNLKISHFTIPLVRAMALGKISQAHQESLILGTDVLKGFLFTLDYLSGYAFFEPIKGFVFEKNLSQSGVFFVKNQDKIEVVAVIQNSPADLLGVLPGDQLISINKKLVQSFTLEEIRELFLGKNPVFIKAFFKRKTEQYQIDFFKTPF